MKRSYLYFLTILFACLLVLFSCRKDIEFILEGKESPSASILENVKIYYMQNIISGSPNRLNAKWKDSWLVRTDGKEILLVPTPEWKLFSKDFDVRRYFAFDIKNEQVLQAHIVEVIGKGGDVAKNVDAVISTSQKDNYDFNGSVIYYDINYNYSHSHAFKDGKLKKDVSSSVVTTPYPNFKVNETIYLKKAGQSKNKKTGSTCPSVQPYWTNIIPADAMGEGCTVTILTETFRDQYGCVTAITYSYMGHQCPSVCTTCGSGSGSGSGGTGSAIGSSDTGGNPPYGGGGGAIIMNHVQDPCVRKMVDSVISKDVEFKARQSLFTIFGQTNDFNLFFYDNDTLGYNILGNCQASNFRYSQGQISGMDAKIQLNSPRLSAMSQEIIAVVTIHEGVHAYLSYRGFISQNNQAQHVVMLKNHVSLIANYLITNFKTPAKEAYALSFTGLDTAFDGLTSTSKQQIINDLSASLGTTFPNANERAIIMADYEMGYKGKKCQ